MVLWEWGRVTRGYGALGCTRLCRSWGSGGGCDWWAVPEHYPPSGMEPGAEAALGGLFYLLLLFFLLAILFYCKVVCPVFSVFLSFFVPFLLTCGMTLTNARASPLGPFCSLDFKNIINMLKINSNLMKRYMSDIIVPLKILFSFLFLRILKKMSHRIVEFVSFSYIFGIMGYFPHKNCTLLLWTKGVNNATIRKFLYSCVCPLFVWIKVALTKLGI